MLIITDMTTMLNFEVISSKFNAVK